VASTRRGTTPTRGRGRTLYLLGRPAPRRPSRVAHFTPGALQGTFAICAGDSGVAVGRPCSLKRCALQRQGRPGVPPPAISRRALHLGGPSEQPRHPVRRWGATRLRGATRRGRRNAKTRRGGGATRWRAAKKRRAARRRRAAPRRRAAKRRRTRDAAEGRNEAGQRDVVEGLTEAGVATRRRGTTRRSAATK